MKAGGLNVVLCMFFSVSQHVLLMGLNALNVIYDKRPIQTKIQTANSSVKSFIFIRRKAMPGFFLFFLFFLLKFHVSNWETRRVFAYL